MAVDDHGRGALRREVLVAPARLVDAADDARPALAEQQDELAALLVALAPEQWAAPTRCEGWDVADVVLHLVQTNRMAIGSATGTYWETVADLADGLGPTAGVDDGAAAMVEKDRGMPTAELLRRWQDGVDELRAAFEIVDPDDKVQWVAGQLRARTLAVTRLAETWIHTGDVAGAIGVELEPAPRLRHVARLAWRTIPYAFEKAGRPAPGPTAFRLVGPDGGDWTFEPDAEAAVNVVTGPGAQLCDVAARRVAPADTELVGEGPDAATILELVRTYA
jgi:uncharacterized protein (TIGR03084 family)